MITNEEKAKSMAYYHCDRRTCKGEVCETCKYAKVDKAVLEMARWKDSHITEQQVKFQCINKEVTMTVGQLIDYYIEREICDVSEECGF